MPAKRISALAHNRVRIEVRGSLIGELFVVDVARRKIILLGKAVINARGMIAQSAFVADRAKEIVQVCEGIVSSAIRQRIELQKVFRDGIKPIGRNDVAGERIAQKAVAIGVRARRQRIINNDRLARRILLILRNRRCETPRSAAYKSPKHS